MQRAKNLDFLFYPKSIAIAGVSDKANKFNFGLRFLEALTRFGFPGQLYSVNPAGGEINGSVIYKSVKDIPGPVDFIISAIPAPIHRNWWRMPPPKECAPFIFLLPVSVKLKTRKVSGYRKILSPVPERAVSV